MNADGSGKVSLTKGPAFDFESDWQPLPDRDLPRSTPLTDC